MVIIYFAYEVKIHTHIDSIDANTVSFIKHAHQSVSPRHRLATLHHESMTPSHHA